MQDTLIFRLIAWVFGVLVVAISSAPICANDKPHVLFIAVDDLRPELGCYGNQQIKSPHIDALAKSGVTFARAYCQQAVCNPSRASIMTGLRPDSTRVWDLITDFRTTIPDAVTIPQHFRKHGYRAVSFGKIFHNPYPDQQSWDEPHRWPAKSRLWSKAAQRRLAEHRRQMKIDGKPEAKIRRIRTVATEIVDYPESEHIDVKIADQGIAAIRQMADAEQPTFVAVGFIRPHLPFVVPRKYWQLYQRDEIPLANDAAFPTNMPQVAFGNRSQGGFYELRDYMDYADATWPLDGSLTEAQQRELKHGYYASVSLIDAQIGRLVAELERLDLRDNTIIVLWGDHGWKLGEHNGWCKQTNFEVDTRSPLIISAPAAKANGETCDALVEFVDVYPTLCELAGLPVPDVLEGISLQPLLNDAAGKVKAAAFSQFPRRHEDRQFMGYAMRTDRYRYVEWLNRKTAKTVATELYDHQHDPQENTNIADDPKGREMVKGLSKQLWSTLDQPTPASQH